MNNPLIILLFHFYLVSGCEDERSTDAIGQSRWPEHDRRHGRFRRRTAFRHAHHQIDYAGQGKST